MTKKLIHLHPKSGKIVKKKSMYPQDILLREKESIFSICLM